MCGIYASISINKLQLPSKRLQTLLSKRGPDHIGSHTAQIECKNGLVYFVSLSSTVLALRGGSVTQQPFVESPNTSALCWNGEAWKFGASSVEGNDGQVLFEALMRASSTHLSCSKSTDAVLKVLRSISGPFAFVFLDRIHHHIYAGRDCLGRRSLLYRSEGGCVEFASVAGSAQDGWKEVEVGGVYQISYASDKNLQLTANSEDKLLSNPSISVAWYSWDVDNNLASKLGTFNRSLPTEESHLDITSRSVSELRNHLRTSLKFRVLNVPESPGLERGTNTRIAVLFSGGLDCTVLARLIHDILPPDQEIDLINVAFENPRVVQAAKKAALNPPRLHNRVDTGALVQNNNSGVSLLTPFESCPDRETGRKACQELQRVCPGRVWRFVAVDVPYEEVLEHREHVIDLIHPHDTEMDLSIALALYFASRGIGNLTSDLSEMPKKYTTPARVLLSGLGADELFGGYTRHSTAFKRLGHAGLLDELELDVNRLGKRNLGRDDRVLSHWGRETRFPYLDESLVKWAVGRPIWEKCSFGQSESDGAELSDLEPGKKVLRLLAYALGMHSVAHEKKRAIQFGARTAKMEVGNTKGTALLSLAR